MNKLRKNMILFLFALLYIPICIGDYLNQPLRFNFGYGSYIEHKYRSEGTISLVINMYVIKKRNK